MSCSRMSRFHQFFAPLALSTGLFFPSLALAQSEPNLDVPYVPTPDAVVQRMLEMAQVGPEDYLIDLGSGDGRIAIAAVRDFKAKGAQGVDIDPERVAEAKANAQTAGLSDQVEFLEQDLFETDISQASVISMYLLPNINLRLRPEILKLAPGTRIVSHAFDMQDWESDQFDTVDSRGVHLWIVPAQVQGTWAITSPEGKHTLKLDQQFQQISGSLENEQGQVTPVQGSLNGSLISFTTGTGETARSFYGTVLGADMQAITPLEGSLNPMNNWQGSRL